MVQRVTNRSSQIVNLVQRCVIHTGTSSSGIGAPTSTGAPIQVCIHVPIIIGAPAQLGSFRYDIYGRTVVVLHVQWEPISKVVFYMYEIHVLQYSTAVLATPGSTS